VLKIDPRNQTARQGGSALVSRYAQLAKDHFKKSNYDQASFCYGRILAIDPQSQVARRGYSALADRYAHLAEENFRKSNYDQALSYYEKVREIDPQSEVARQGCRAIGSHYAHLAEDNFKKFNYAQARDYVELGLHAASHHERLLSLRKELDAPLASRLVQSVRYNGESFMEGTTAAASCDICRFSYSIHTVNAMPKRDFAQAARRGEYPACFLSTTPGRNPREDRDELRETIISLCKQNYSILDIKAALGAREHHVSRDFMPLTCTESPEEISLPGRSQNHT
jgi:tetratricopeptide (TPR) repeat protein